MARFELYTKAQGPTLDKYTRSRDRVALIRGPLGSGKTFASCEKVFKVMCEQKPNSQGIRKTRWYAIRNTYPDLMSTTVKDWLDLFGDLGKFTNGGSSPPTHRLQFRLQDRSIVKSELIFLALDRPQAIKKLRGAQATAFWLNEIKELLKSVVDMADLRHGRYPSKMEGGPTWHGMIGDTNAPEDDSWYYNLSEIVKPKGWVFFNQPGGLLKEMGDNGEWTGEWLENPEAENLKNLPDKYYVRGREGKSDDWILVNLANEYGTVQDGKAIYEKQWNDRIHVNDKIRWIPGEPIAVGLDFGLTPAAVIGQETPAGQVNILKELVSTGMGINQFANEVLRPVLRKDFPNSSITFIGDPAGSQRAQTNEQTVFKELAEECNILCEPANSNDPEIRWEAVRWFLQQLRDGNPAFQVSPTCTLLRRGFNGGYKLRRLLVAGEERYSLKADKNKYSHPHDALQYLTMYFRGDAIPTQAFTRPTNLDRWAV